MAKGKKWLQALKTQSSTKKEWKLARCNIHLETGGMTSKGLGHSYSYKKGTFEKSVNKRFECCQEKKFLRRGFEKIQTGNQIVISKLESGLSSWFQN